MLALTAQSDGGENEKEVCGDSGKKLSPKFIYCFVAFSNIKDT